MSSSDSSSESDSESVESPDETPKPKTTRLKGYEPVGDPEGNYMCNACGKRYTLKHHTYVHLRFCEETKKNSLILKCKWCNLEFANRGNLVTHAFHIHGDSSYKSIRKLNNKISDGIKCDVCEREFKYKVHLTYHIRRVHFNLKAKIPYAEIKNVNQVWFENVLNSNNIMEIKKISHNALVMRKLDKDTTIKVNEPTTPVVDLSTMYPIGNSKQVARVTCSTCHKSYLKRDYKKHIEETHMNRTKHHCNNCNRTFKRSYHFLQHVCGRVRKIKGIKSFDKTFRIANVESLAFPLG